VRLARLGCRTVVSGARHFCQLLECCACFPETADRSSAVVVVLHTTAEAQEFHSGANCGNHSEPALPDHTGSYRIESIGLEETVGVGK
jgi:hypothetical protein